MSRGAVYTIVWNTLDCPSIVVPVTKVDASKDQKLPPHEFRNPDDEAIFNLCKILNSHGRPHSYSRGYHDR